MKPERWDQIENLYKQALDVDESQRTAFLREVCAGDESLRQDLEGLLAEEPNGVSFLEEPALHVIARKFAAATSHSWVGRQIGNYQFLSLLGSGGMGDVYRAKDLRLKREVAIKLLPDAFAHDAERVARFQREAEVLASLNHPHIAGIYDLEHFGLSRFLVLELVEGMTLADRIARGPIPIDESLAIAKQIAEALEAAHEKGIIHRDLKPANIKLTPDGNVKVLDFGLAKVCEAERGVLSLSNSPTLVTATPGMILGTAAYMSPEQAKGIEADRTSDVWAFGCVLYEMLTGRRVFEGGTVSEILADILKGEPDWNRLPGETPESIRHLLHRCLRKERKLRLHDMADARIEIEEPRIPTVVQTVSRHRERFAWIFALALVTVVAAVLGMRAFRSLPSPQEMRFEITTPPTPDPTSLAISSDGQKLVFVAAVEGRSGLWLRSLDSVSARSLPGTEGAGYPFWSPDSRAVGFFADGNLKRIDIDSGSVQALTKVRGNGRGGAWNRDGTILFASSMNTPIFRVSAAGGAPAAVTRLEAQQANHRFPQFLPDGRHFLYYVLGNPEARGVYIGQLDALEPRRLFDADTAAMYASSGHLLFVRQGTLFAQHFDPVGLALIGEPFSVAKQVAIDAQSSNLGAVATSEAGPIVYRTGSAGGQRQLAWFDRSGNEIGKVGDAANAWSPSLSPDGRRVAMFGPVNGNIDISVLELGRGIFTRFTSDTAVEAYPIWSPDGSRIVFLHSSQGRNDLYQKAVINGTEEPLLSTPQAKWANDWSADGRFLLYVSEDPKTGRDLWVSPMDGDGKPFPVVQTEADERDGQFSPDGKWIAYQSDESGRSEIYVQPFPGPGARTRISSNGGAQVRWPGDGKELFYIALDERLMAVPIRTMSEGKTINADAPVPLFATRVGGAVTEIKNQHYVVSPDGQRFLMSTVIEEAASPITVILNWKPPVK